MVPATKILSVINRIDELTRVESFLGELGDEWDLPMPLVYSINLALEEGLANIVSYGFDDDTDHVIEIVFVKNDDELTITLIDDGHEYDPTLKEDPDITLPAEERPIGGLGIFLIKRIMDKVEYQRKDNRNYLILTKKSES